METLFDRLRIWRRERALGLDLPPYFILSYAHLAEIAARQPTGLDQLSSCPGMGPKKLAQFGPELLVIILEARSEGLESGVLLPVETAPPPSLSDSDLALIASALRSDVAQRLARRLKGQFTALQIEEALRRMQPTPSAS